MSSITIRRLEPGDEDLLARLALDTQSFKEDRFEEAGGEAVGVPLAPADATTFLSDEHTHVFVAFLHEEPVGFVVVNELLHRHTFTRMFLVYEIGVAVDHRRKGVGRALLDAVRALAVERGVPEGFVLTNESNAPAMALYAAAGGTRPHVETAEWDFRF